MSTEFIRPKVFISYSHDSTVHKDRVLSLADQLRKNGVDCSIDQNETSPEKGWQRWMLNEIEVANFVLVVCSELHDRRFKGEEEVGKGKGATWEAAAIIQELYDASGYNSKFIPILLEANDSQFIPSPLRSATYYMPMTTEGYNSLYGRLTNQPPTPKQELGEFRKLDKRDRKQLFSDSSTTSSEQTKSENQPQSRKLEVDSESIVQVSKKKLKSRAWRGYCILGILYTLLLGVVITFAATQNIFGWIGSIIFPAISWGTIHLFFTGSLAQYHEDMYLYSNRPGYQKCGVISQGRVIEDDCEDYYSMYIRTAACLYDFCEGQIELTKTTQKEIEQLGKIFVGRCSDGREDHLHHIDNIWVATKVKLDLRTPEKAQ
jgi:SEFIR domain